jgi:hypothetical protein
MTSPEQAIRQARLAAAEAQARGEYVEPPPSFEVESVSRIAEWRLAEWALIEPDAAEVYSTRRLGAPITWFKRLLLRALRQYHGQVLAQQSRFNSHVAGHIMNLDDRISALEGRTNFGASPFEGAGNRDPGEEAGETPSDADVAATDERPRRR